VRVSTPADLAGVAGVLEAAYPVLMAAAYDEAELGPALPLMTRAQPALLESGTYYVAEVDRGEIIGCGGWTAARPGDGLVTEGVAHLRHFGTHPEWTGRGVGTAIYRRCERDAGIAGARHLECYSSLNAEGFYAAMGFALVARIEIELRDGVRITSAHMQRTI
jgi:GNAT superfamily N-acetyltransferase